MARFLERCDVEIVLMLAPPIARRSSGRSAGARGGDG